MEMPLLSSDIMMPLRPIATPSNHLSPGDTGHTAAKGPACFHFSQDKITTEIQLLFFFVIEFSSQIVEFSL